LNGPVSGNVDLAGRALLMLSVRSSTKSPATPIEVWVDSGFTGELVLPQQSIERLGLSKSSAIAAGLADGSQVVLDTYSCIVEWFGEQRAIEVVESSGQLTFPLLGVGLLQDHRLEIDYRLRTLQIG
jgi:clan AA aspartic protease